MMECHIVSVGVSQLIPDSESVTLPARGGEMEVLPDTRKRLHF